MERTASYRARTFVVADPDARLRQGDDLNAFVPAPSALEANATDFARIPQHARVRVDEVRIVARGAGAPMLFAYALDAETGRPWGWTSTRNFEGRFINETLGAIPPVDKSTKGPNAAWADGRFLRQLTLVRIVDARMDIEHIALDTLGPYLDLCEAAARDGVAIAINSGFRTYHEQKRLRDGYERKLPGYNLAAKAGYSKHQNGVAFDFAVPGGTGDPRYDWLTRNAPRFGFVRTVNGEPWHWEYDRRKAETAVASGTFKTSNVTV